jgi:S-adenosylmethionine/arginine decarboxylase-like enzyme
MGCIRIRLGWIATHFLLAIVAPYSLSQWGLFLFPAISSPTTKNDAASTRESIDALQSSADTIADTTGECSDDGDHLSGAAQHILVDIQNVDRSFLLDKERLAQAMVQLTGELSSTNSNSLTLASYQCQTPPTGGSTIVSCVGVFVDSTYMITFYTWPQAGVMSLDIFSPTRSSSSGDFLPKVPALVQELFAIPAASGVMRWLYKRRGKLNLQGLDIAWMLGSEGIRSSDNSYSVFTTTTDFQEVTIVEVASPKIPFPRGVPHNEATNTDKKVFLDGVTQSSLHAIEAYHEALVHPAMLAHAHPKRVAIIGGGEGSTLREVLKHKTVETCTMLDIDDEFVNEFGREHLQEWNDCSDFAYNSDKEGYVSCFDDPRTDLHTVDAIGWFIDRFGDDATIDESQKYDVIIMDAL